MNIKRSDSEHLIIVDFPIFPAIWFSVFGFMGLLLVMAGFRENELNPGKIIVGSIFLLIGFGSQFFLLNRSTFYFDLQKRLVTWKIIGLLGRKGGTIAFDQIDFAYLEYSCGKGINYRPVLKLGPEVVPLRPYTTYDTSSQVCDEINRALGKPVRTMEEDVEVTVQALVSRKKWDIAVHLVKRLRRFNSVQAWDYIKSFEKA